MSATNDTAQDILDLIFTATAWANMADDAGTSPFTNLYISLHTSSPGETGDQTTNETAYTNYARVAVARTTSGWTTASADPATVTNDAAITFAQCGATGATLTNFGIGSASSGTGILFFHGALDSNLAVSDGITPEFAINALTITLD